MACGANCTTVAPPTEPPKNSTGKFSFPPNCEVTDTCKILAKFGTNPANNSQVALTLEGRPEPEQETFWFALGVAPGPLMPGAMVMECVVWKNGSKTQNGVFTSYNDQYNNIRTPTDGVATVSTNTMDGKYTCSMVVDVVRTVRVNGNSHTFDLNKPYYLLLAKGLVKDGNNKEYHHDSKIFSSDPRVVNSTSGGDTPAGVTTKTLKKTHAILMVIAWNFCAAMGMFFARHTKDMWPNTQPFNVKLWFTIHRGHMVTAVALSIAAFVIIFVDKQQLVYVPHAYTGIATFILALIQPSIAMFRPHPGTPNRKYFNWIHWSIGYGTLLLAGVTMALGTLLDALDVHSSATWIIVGSFVYNALLQLILEIYKSSKASDQRRISKEHLVASDGITTTEKTVVTQSTEPLEPNDMVRSLILGATWAGLLVTTVALTVLIGLG